jgi:hypothetical protein
LGMFLLLVLFPLPAHTQETPGPNEALEAAQLARIYDQAIARFNNDIKDFPSWEAFKTAVFPKITADTIGKCYEYTGGATQSVIVTAESLPKVEDGNWQKTAGGGWKQVQGDRTFSEYRVNEKARVLLRMEGVKPRFFFAPSPKMCEFPW